MCGIAGVRRYGANPINPEEVKTLLQSLEHRGNHATGIALMVNGHIQILKAPRPAWDFCASDETKQFLDQHLPDATIALLHTRFATQGNPIDNKNNHPMFMNKTAVVHNGGIRNYQEVFNNLKVDKSCETDSDIFRAIFDKEGFTQASVEWLNKLNGSAAIAAISEEEPEMLVLGRSGSPLVYGLTEDKLWWASEIQAIQRAVRPWKNLHGLWGRQYRADVAYYTVPDHTIYFQGPNGLEGKHKMFTCAAYNQPIYNMRATYADKMKAFKASSRATTHTPSRLLESSVKKEKKMKHHRCPNKSCASFPSIPFEEKWYGYICQDCKTSLGQLENRPSEEFIISNWESK